MMKISFQKPGKEVRKKSSSQPYLCDTIQLSLRQTEETVSWQYMQQNNQIGI
jgi:hypothetical protein